ncbi:MAG TPA: glycosyltransferase [Chromatiales bacterium]|nr:glycosyltransferase [Chromatiales bacterium]
MLAVAAYLAAAIWVGILLWPARPWNTRQRIEAGRPDADPGELTVLIPARNEAQTIVACLRSVLAQGPTLRIVVVDDRSEDRTAEMVSALGSERITLISGQPLPTGWTGKLWALQQGLAHASTEQILLLDADILLAPGILSVLKAKLLDDGLGLVSIMARLRTETFWERLLVPAYIYFFKLLYPFAQVNTPTHRMAAAAGGCILLRKDALEQAGGFDVLKDALIDDCTLAARIKQAGWPIHLALSHAVTSIRGYAKLNDLWRLVARTAYTQLNYSVMYLLGCTFAMLVMFVAPVLAVLSGNPPVVVVGMVAWLVMALTQLPVMHFYGLSPVRALLLPLVAVLFLGMTWDSARRYWTGAGARWKGRAYDYPDRSLAAAPGAGLDDTGRD